ncbi:MAG: hypothetical protein COV35_05310 [Alphaproteobacteria bacterium CG11_big_fil_rev_8_21_14_0_20_39_49]|nr:MAG: hypothetical protein COV35_05310 [Alphaproteobacteria bacterium CG11_big_fil_rev_8_21_14_0_20_39_49]
MVKRLWILFILALIAALAGDFYMHPHNKFEIANYRFFNAIFGFASCVAIVIVSKVLGVFLKRKENYYKEVREDE